MKNKLITATLLKGWASKRESQSIMPELIKRLIISSGAKVRKMSIPSGDNVYIPGWDGQVSSDSPIFNVSAGISLWEIGTNSDVTTKANNDYNKRTNDSLGYDRTKATFVFVTPRIWEQAGNWVKEKKSENKWKDIVVFTAIELEDWIAQYPVVAIWLADKIGTIKNTSLDYPQLFWNKWAKGEKYVLPPSLLLGGREDAINAIKVSLRVPKVIYVQSVSREESLAFICAVAIECQAKAEDTCQNIVIAKEERDVQELVDNYENLVIITYAVGSWNYATDKGHTIICAVSPEEQINDVIELQTIERRSFVNELKTIGIEEDVANRYAISTARSPLALRRLLHIDQLKPAWLRSENIQNLLPAIFVGRWNDSVDGDKKILEKLAGHSYDDFEKIIRNELFSNESLFLEAGGNWRLRSAYEAIGYSASFMTISFKETFAEIVNEVLSDDDPDAVNKIEATDLCFWNFKQKYSFDLKEGICHTLILLSLQGNSDFVHDILSKFYASIQIKRFLSTRNLLPLLAEADPASFITFLKSDLKQGGNIVSSLFKKREKEYSFYGPCMNFVQLLFALEGLAWNDKYLKDVSMILLELTIYKIDDNVGNKPIISLERIFRAILPQTYADENIRLKILDAIVTKYPIEGFYLCLAILNNFGDRVFEYSYHFKWRFSDLIHKTNKEFVINFCYLEHIVELLLSVMPCSPKYIKELISLYAKPEMKNFRNLLIAKVESLKNFIKGNEEICSLLRQEINFNEAEKRKDRFLNNVELGRLKKLLEDIRPTDVVLKNLWLFENNYRSFKMDYHISFEERHAHILNLRKRGILDVYQAKGMEGLGKLCNMVESPKEVGQTLGEMKTLEINDWLCKSLVNGAIPPEVIYGYFRVLNFKQDKSFIQLIEKIENVDKRILLLANVGYNGQIAKYISSFAVEFQNKYWSNVNVWSCENTEVEMVVKKLNSVGRFRNSFELIYGNGTKMLVSDELMLDSVIQLLHGSKDGMPEPFEFVKILTYLDKSDSPIVKENIMMVELLFYNYIRQDVNLRHFQLFYGILHNPSTMLELIKLAWLPDNEQAKEIRMNEFAKNKNLSSIAKIALEILHGLEAQPCENNNGVVNGQDLKKYAKELLETAKSEYLERPAMYVIGKLLGNINLGEDYPPHYLGEILEELDKDEIDDEYRRQLFNRHGFTCRAYNEGGTIERKKEKKFLSYAEKTRFTYDRITIVFEKLASEYHHMGDREDVNAKLEDLDN